MIGHLKDCYTLIMRAGHVGRNEPTDDIRALADKAFTVNKTSVGGICDVLRAEHTKFGVGGLVSRYMRAEDLKVS